MRVNCYIKFLHSGCEGRAYATLESPKGVLAAILKALDFHGVTREQIKEMVDLPKLEAQFAAIDERAFRQLLSACDYHQLQILLTENGQRQPPGLPPPPSDRGTIFGPVL